MPPKGCNDPQPIGLKSCKFAARNKNNPAATKTTSAEIFKTTKMLFAVADSRMPIESSTLSPITNTAPTTSNCECMTSQLPGFHHGPLRIKLDCCAQLGSASPTLLKTS